MKPSQKINKKSTTILKLTFASSKGLKKNTDASIIWHNMYFVIIYCSIVIPLDLRIFLEIKNIFYVKYIEV